MWKKGALQVHSLAALAIVALFFMVFLVSFGSQASPTGAISAAVSSCMQENIVLEEVPYKSDDGVARTHVVERYDWDAIRECRHERWSGKFTRKEDVYDSPYALRSTSYRFGDFERSRYYDQVEAHGNERPVRHNIVGKSEGN